MSVTPGRRRPVRHNNLIFSCCGRSGSGEKREDRSVEGWLHGRGNDAWRLVMAGLSANNGGRDRCVRARGSPQSQLRWLGPGGRIPCRGAPRGNTAKVDTTWVDDTRTARWWRQVELLAGSAGRSGQLCRGEAPEAQGDLAANSNRDRQIPLTRGRWTRRRRCVGGRALARRVKNPNG